MKPHAASPTAVATLAVLAALAAAAVLPLPASGEVGAGSAPIEIYGHLDGLQDFMMNTQTPEPRGDDGPAVLSGHTVACADAPLAGGWGLHAWTGFYSSGPVEYAFEENGHPRIWPGEKLAGDLRPDTMEPVMMHWYLATGAAGHDAPAVVPQVVVQATVRAGVSSGVEDAAFHEGDLVAQGRTSPATLSPALDGHPHVTYEPAGGREVYHFAVPLLLEVDHVPAEDGFGIRVEAFVEDPLCSPGTGQVMPDLVAAHAGPDQWPRLSWSIWSPLATRSYDHAPADDGVALRWNVSSVFGSRDIDPQGLRATVVDARGSRAVLAPEVLLPAGYGHFADPVSATFVVPSSLVGPVHVRLEATNLQYTAGTVLELTVDPATGEVREGVRASVSEAPGWPVAGLVGAVLLSAVLRRRRA